MESINAIARIVKFIISSFKQRDGASHRSIAFIMAENLLVKFTNGLWKSTVCNTTNILDGNQINMKKSVSKGNIKAVIKE